MPRICVLINNDFTHDNRVRREAESLHQAGYDVTVFALVSKNPEVPQEEVQEGVHIHRIIRDTLFNYHPFNKRAFKTIVQLFLKHRGFDFVHAHDANTLVVGYWLSRLYGAQLVYDSHEYWTSIFDEERKRLHRIQADLDPGLLKKRLGWIDQFERFEAWALPRCSGVISVSDSIGQRLEKKAQGPLNHYQTLRNICEYATIEKTDRFHQEFELPPDTKVVLYQGGITEIRGIPSLLDMMEQLDDLNVALVLMGPSNGQYFPKLVERIGQSPQLRKRVFYKQSVPHTVLASWTAAADLAIHPILDCRENHHVCLPNKVFEYIQGETPLAVTNVPEMKHIVDTYQVGFTFDPENPTEMATLVRQYFQSPNRQAAYKDNIRKAKKELCWENEANVLVHLYNTLSKAPPTPTHATTVAPSS